VGAALVAGDRVDLVDDHGAQLRQPGAAALAGQQDVERLRRGDQDVRRAPRELGALADRRVAGAHRDADLGELDAARRGMARELGERRLEVALDVVRQRLERRDIEDRGVVTQRPVEPTADQLVEARQERRERPCPTRSARRSARRGAPRSSATPRAAAR